MTFPAVEAENLEGEKYKIPSGLDGELNLVILAYEREHQRLVDTYLPAARTLEKQVPGFRVYELPTLGDLNFMARSFIDGGMRRGIKDAAQRAATITLYLDRDPFLKQLGIPDTTTIDALLINRQGKVLWRQRGPATPDSLQKLSAEVKSRRPSSK